MTHDSTRPVLETKRVFRLVSAAATTLRFDGRQHFRLALSGVSRDPTTFNASLRFRTRQSACHLLTLTSSAGGGQVRLFVDEAQVRLRVPSLAARRRSSTSTHLVVSLTFVVADLVVVQVKHSVDFVCVTGQ